MDLFIAIKLDDMASKGAENIANSIGNKLTQAFKVASAAVAAFGGMTIKSYADYEQLVGGVETLFKENADTVKKYAKEAYLTSGMSANTYMETVTSFSASLLQSLEGDTKKAAEYSNRALIDMSDNANKMGSDLETLRTAYSGFAKQNYTIKFIYSPAA